MNRLVSGVRSSGLVKVVMCFAALAFLLVFYGLAVRNTPETEAVIATDFQAGRIIDDAVFYNANTMTVEEIQAFLDEKLPTCDMWGTGSSAGRVVSETGYVMPAGSTNADYARLRAAAGNSRYHEPPYVCVNKYYENPETHETLYETNGIVKDGMISAAQIIYNEAQRYSINPQVLLVLLKKESYVWGDTWPLKWEYNSAMGYGCPDTAPCDTAYYGFYNQVHMAAYQFDRYKQKNYEYNYHPGMVNNIYYSPTYSCGTKQVYIENMATASLYIYTPYTPNDAALQNYPGTSYCGSYGNRNFFMYFSEWFGSTIFVDQYRQITEYSKKVDYLGEELQGGDKCFNDICYKKLEYGYIFGNRSTAWDIHGGIYQKWKSLNAEDSILGLPTGNEVRQDTGVVYQDFERGRIYWIEDKAVTMHGGIYSYWMTNENEAIATIGYPTNGEEKDDDGNTFQQYDNGRVYWNEKFGAWSISGELLDYWLSLGGVDSYLGVSESLPVKKDDGGVAQKFNNGWIYWKEPLGVENIHGGILDKWLTEDGMGYPVGGEVKDENKNTYQDFENGRIYWNNDVGTWVLKKFSLDHWLKTGGVAGYLGYPTDSGQCGLLSGACYQMFSGGRIYWTSDSGTHDIHGGILNRWIAEGLEWRKLGFPVGDEIIDNKDVYQKFEGGTIYWNQYSGTWIK